MTFETWHMTHDTWHVTGGWQWQPLFHLRHSPFSHLVWFPQMVYGVCNKERDYCICKGSSTTYSFPKLAGLQESAKIPGWWKCHTQGRLYTTNSVKFRLRVARIEPQTLKTEKHTCCGLNTWQLWWVKVHPGNQTDTLLSQNWAWVQALTWGPSPYST